MAKEGLPYVLVPAILALVLAYFGLWLLAGLFAIVTGFMAFFFRDPERNIPDDPNLIVSAADGRVTRIDELDDKKVVSVFLSPLDVHINRSPIAGRVVDIEYVAGRKSPATSNEASLVNERNSLTIDGENVSIVCTQIAGILARRIVCWKHTGDELKAGERFGLIKFSSRTDVSMPSDVEVVVKVGEKVRGGETVIARLKQ